jgi:transglutaminase-like putative cysteine protease
MVSHMEVQATNEAAARRIGEQQLYYVESRDTVEVVEAYTQKRDGRKLPVSPSAIHEQTPPGAAEMAMFDDRRVKIVVFPDVEAGDTVVLTARYSDKPALPGHYTLHMVANRMQPQLGWRVTVTAPTAMAMQVETHDLAFEKRVYGDKTVYEWRYANPAAITDPKFGLDVSDLWPRFYLSSYKSYDEMAKDYAAEADSTTTVTPAIQAQADEITSGVSDKKRQAELIYGWVSRHIRYVAVEIGASAYIPHPAESVLTNGYGDCKDHSVLVVALLKAKHIKAQLVLINLGTSYALGVPPVFGSLNHEIAYLPDMGLYIDTTAGEAPFGTLPFAEYGKPVVHIGSEAPALRRTPILPPGAASITLRTTARLEADGRVIGDSEAESAGPFALGMRQYAVAIQQAGSEQAVKAVLRQTGKEGIGSFNFASPFDPSPSYKIDGHFEITPHPEYLAGASFALPSELEAGWRPGEELLGPLDLMDLQGAQPTACFSGHEIEERVLELPAGKRVRDLPKGLDITDKILTYHSVWSVAGHSVTWRRELTTTVDQPVCLGAVRQEAAKALNDIRGDLNSGVITLIDDAAASKG